jgi:hypothetical protein
MTRNEINVALASVLTTVAETGGPAPLTFLYLPLQASMGIGLDDFYELMGIIAKAGLGVTTSETLTLTQAGKELAGVIEEHAAARRTVTA